MGLQRTHEKKDGQEAEVVFISFSLAQFFHGCWQSGVHRLGSHFSLWTTATVGLVGCKTFEIGFICNHRASRWTRKCFVIHKREQKLLSRPHSQRSPSRLGVQIHGITAIVRDFFEFFDQKPSFMKGTLKGCIFCTSRSVLNEVKLYGGDDFNV